MRDEVYAKFLSFWSNEFGRRHYVRIALLHDEGITSILDNWPMDGKSDFELPGNFMKRYGDSLKS